MGASWRRVEAAGKLGVEDETLDRMGALGMISVFDVEEVGDAVLMDELGMTEALALEIIERCSKKAHEISEQQEREKAEAEAKQAEQNDSADAILSAPDAEAESAVASILGGDSPKMTDDPPASEGATDQQAEDAADALLSEESAPPADQGNV